jgi:hypothetical protein
MQNARHRWQALIWKRAKIPQLCRYQYLRLVLIHLLSLLRTAARYIL